MCRKTEIIKGVVLYQKAKELEDKAKAKRDAALAIIYGKSDSGMCSTSWDVMDDSGKKAGVAIEVQIGLGDYLSLFPDSKPTIRNYVYSGKAKMYMDYSGRYLDEKDNVSVYVSARTPSVDAPLEMQPKVETAPEATTVEESAAVTSAA